MVFGILLGLQDNLPDLIITLIVLGELTADIGLSSRKTCVRSSLTDFTGFHQPIIPASQLSWTLMKEGRQTKGCAVQRIV